MSKSILLSSLLDNSTSYRLGNHISKQVLCMGTVKIMLIAVHKLLLPVSYISLIALVHNYRSKLLTLNV